MQNEPDAQLSWVLLMEVVEGAGVSGELGLAAIAEPPWHPGDEFGNPGIFDDDAFDCARRGNGLDAGLLSQGVEKPWQLVRVTAFRTGGSVDPSQGGNDIARNGVEGLGVLEAPHGIPQSYQDWQ